MSDWITEKAQAVAEQICGSEHPLAYDFNLIKSALIEAARTAWDEGFDDAPDDKYFGCKRRNPYKVA